jgi:hypothetical protein
VIYHNTVRFQELCHYLAFVQYHYRMTIAEKQRQEQQLYEKHLDEIVAAIQRGDDGIGVSTELAEATGIDQKTVYKWYRITEDRIEAYQKLHVGVLAGVMWIGILLGVGLLISIFLPSIDVAPATAWGVGALALVTAGSAIFALRGARERATRRWVERERSADG